MKLNREDKAYFKLLAICVMWGALGIIAKSVGGWIIFIGILLGWFSGVANLRILRDMQALGRDNRIEL